MTTVITAQPLTLTTRASISTEVLVQETGDEAVLLDLAGEQYFGLDPVGLRIWRLLEGGADLRGVCDTLLAEYDVGAAQVEGDVIALVGQLRDAGLVTVG
ncbi:MAG: PqqD family protein [Proteobacteria bacterium]|nr:PqqD family protein [Pseudomonadota bacterium]